MRVTITAIFLPAGPGIPLAEVVRHNAHFRLGEQHATSGNMRLKISQDGRISYRRTGSELNVDVNIELSAFEGDSFVAGVGPLRTVFNVSRPPHVRGSTKRMVVDGVELAKVD